MYACEMQTCCYNSVKYYAGIKFHFYQATLKEHVSLASQKHEVAEHQ
jgi:hypothetical protein